MTRLDDKLNKVKASCEAAHERVLREEKIALELDAIDVPEPKHYVFQADGSVWLCYSVPYGCLDDGKPTADDLARYAQTIAEHFPPLDRWVRSDTFFHNCNVNEIDKIRERYETCKYEHEAGGVYVRISEYEVTMAFDCEIAGEQCKIKFQLAHGGGFGRLRIGGYAKRYPDGRVARWERRELYGVPEGFTGKLYAAGSPESLGQGLLYTTPGVADSPREVFSLLCKNPATSPQ